MPSFINEVTITPGGTGWQTVNLSAYIPSNAAAVFLKNRNPIGFSYSILARATGDTNSYLLSGGDGGILRDGACATQCVACDSGQNIDIYLGTTGLIVTLYGYLTKDELASITTPHSVTAGAATTWTTVDLSSHISSYTSQQVYGVVLMSISASIYGGISGARPTGSSVSNSAVASQDQPYQGCFVVQFTSGNGYKVDLYSSFATTPYYIVGFLVKDIVQSYNTELDVSPSTSNVGSWVDISTLPSNATAGIYVTVGYPGGTGGTYGLEPKTSPSIQVFGNVAGGFGCAAMGAGANNKIQGYRGSATTSFHIYEMGYWKLPPGGELFNGAIF